jgi:hypothetical protein
LNDAAAAKNVTQSKKGSLTGAGLGLTRPVAPPQDSSAALQTKPEQLTSPDQVPQGLEKSDWANIRAAHAAWEHSFQPVKGGAYRIRDAWRQTRGTTGKLIERLRVGTVDAFQGKEFDVVLLSMSRSSAALKAWWLSSKGFMAPKAS